MIKPVDGELTTGFFEPRPVTDPGKHIHGAIDLRAPVGTVIHAPESGSVFGYIAIRPKEGMVWPAPIKINGLPFPYNNYFYDMYGGIIILMSHNGNLWDITRTHVIAHTYGNQIFNRSMPGGFKNSWIEQKADDRFPIIGMYTEKVIVTEGDPIGFVGNAGYSTGSHIHWEIHNSYKWQKHEDRVNPERFL